MKAHPVILVVDDQEVFGLISTMLNNLINKPRLVHCRTHHEAMSYVASDEYADFIFADWDMSGYRFMEAVRSDLENHNTPVVIMSEDTTNKKIVLNSTTSEATFFLAKPFLEKGLAKKYDKALKTVERRRKQRINPFTSPLIPILFDGSESLTLPLVDISIDGCLFRAPHDVSRSIHIYQHVMVALQIEEFDVRAQGEVYRIGHDRPVPEQKDSVLIMIKFIGSDQQEREVQDLVDELAKRW